MAKKLKVEVEADTKKARQKLKELADGTAGDAGGNAVATSAERAAKALDKAAKNVKNLGDEADGASVNMRNVVKGFAGIAAGMAASYAANHMEPGVGKTALGYASSMLAGASTGAMMGSMIPGVGTVGGAIIGGTVGGVKQYLDNSSSEEDWYKDWQKGEDIFSKNKDWSAKLEELTSVKTRFKGLSGLEELKAQLAEVDAASKRTGDAMKELQYAEKDSVNIINSIKNEKGLTADERIQKASDEASQLAETRQKLSQVEGASKRLASMREAIEDSIANYKPKPEFRASTDALDALSRIGGNFGGGDLGRDQLNVQREMAQTLKSLDQKATNGGGIWQ